MARAVPKTQRDSSQVRLLIDSHEPFLNYSIEVALKNICDALNNDGTGTPAGHVRRVCRPSHEISFYLQSGSSAFNVNNRERTSLFKSAHSHPDMRCTLGERRYMEHNESMRKFERLMEVLPEKNWID